MEAFREYLVKHRIVPPKQIDFYMTWVRMFLIYYYFLVVSVVWPRSVGL
jgi:hypothetical protein